MMAGQPTLAVIYGPGSHGPKRMELGLWGVSLSLEGGYQKESI